MTTAITKGNIKGKKKNVNWIPNMDFKTPPRVRNCTIPDKIPKTIAETITKDVFIFIQTHMIQ